MKSIRADNIYETIPKKAYRHCLGLCFLIAASYIGDKRIYVCVVVLWFYAVATVFQSHNSGQYT